MARITPDGISKVWFVPTLSSTTSPSLAQIEAGTELTPFITPQGVNTPDEGQEADASDLSSARDKTVPSTVSGQYTGEFYRDDVPANDEAWSALPRLAEGYLVIARFGGSGTDNAIAATDSVEVTQVRVANRSNSGLPRGQVLRFSTVMSVSAEPVLDATVAA